jgi:hypothetical protein
VREVLPRWDDEAAVAKLVDDEMRELRSEVDRLAWTTSGHAPEGPEDLVEVWNLAQAEASRGWPPEGERAAVAAAARGDVRPLADLLRPLHHLGFLPDEVNPAIKNLSPATWSLVVQFLTGERNLRTGRNRGEPGRPKMTAEERRAANPVHDAAEEVPAIAAILRKLYPSRAKSALLERAVEIAARRKRVRRDTLARYLGRSRKDPHRVR